MGLLRRLVGGDKPPRPDWSPFDDARTHQAFIDAVEADLQRRGVRYAMEDGLVQVVVEGQEEPAQYGLANLSQQCAANEQDDWARIIATHFSSVFST